MKLTRWLTAAALVLMTALVVTTQAERPPHPPQNTSADGPRTAEIGQPAPDFELTNLVTGETHKLSDYRGKVVVLQWQGLRCPWDYMRPDAGYQRYLSPLAARYAQQDVVWLAINSNYDESNEDLKAYVQQHQIAYPFLDDADANVARVYGARTTPHMFVIDTDGVLRYAGGVEEVPGKPSDCGQMQENYIEPVLNALLAGEELPYTRTRSKGCTIKWPPAE